MYLSMPLSLSLSSSTEALKVSLNKESKLLEFGEYSVKDL